MTEGKEEGRVFPGQRPNERETGALRRRARVRRQRLIFAPRPFHPSFLPSFLLDGRRRGTRAAAATAAALRTILQLSGGCHTDSRPDQAFRGDLPLCRVPFLFYFSGKILPSIPRGPLFPSHFTPQTKGSPLTGIEYLTLCRRRAAVLFKDSFDPLSEFDELYFGFSTFERTNPAAPRALGLLAAVVIICYLRAIATQANGCYLVHFSEEWVTQK